MRGAVTKHVNSQSELTQSVGKGKNMLFHATVIVQIERDTNRDIHIVVYRLLHKQIIGHNRR